MRALARFTIARPRFTIAVWLLLAVAAALPAGQLSREVGNGGYEVSGSQSSRVSELAASSFPRSEGQALAAVFRSSSPARAELRDRAAELRRRLAARPEVSAVGEAYASPSGRMVVLPFALSGDLAEAQKAVVPLRSWVGSVAGPGVTLLGQAAVWEETTAISKEDLARAERFSLPVTLVILIAAFLSVIAALVPIGLALVVLVVAFAALGLLSNLVDMNVYVTNTAQLLGIGLAIDYSLFIVSRYREQRRAGLGTDAAIVETVATTGRAVVVSGVTIAIGLSSLAMLGVGVFSSMAIGAAAAAAIAALGAVTLVPAVLQVLGGRIDRFSIRPAARAAARGGLWRSLGEAILRRRWPVLIASTLALVLCAAPLLGANLMFAGADGLLPASNQVRQSSDAVLEEFGENVLEPIEMISRPGYAGRIRAAALRDPGVATALAGETGRHDWTRVNVLTAAGSGTAGSDETVRRLRDQVSRLVPQGAAFVGGQPALGVDLIERVESRFPLMILMACLLAFVLLLIALRSLVVPLKAVATNLLSVAATVGLVSLFFEQFGGADGLAWFVPPFLFAIVFGLSMDYEIFLLSRVREEYDRTGDNDAAVANALQQSGRPITLAALVIMLVFLTSANTSLESFRQLGVGMALAVFLDATLVRCGLVPAALAVLGDRNWWLPSFLARLVPGGREPVLRPATADLEPSVD